MNGCAIMMVSFWVAKSLISGWTFMALVRIFKTINSKLYDCFWARRKTKGPHYPEAYFLSIAMGHIKVKSERKFGGCAVCRHYVKEKYFLNESNQIKTQSLSAAPKKVKLVGALGIQMVKSIEKPPFGRKGQATG